METVLFFLLPTGFASSLAVVYSGSMEPVMPTGALAVMQTVVPAQIEVGDIISFNPPNYPNQIVSHRVIAIHNNDTLSFTTKGDANEDSDWEQVPAANVLSKVIFNIPYMGYILENIAQYSKSNMGFIILVGFPTVWLIGSALRDINITVSSDKRRERQQAKLLKQQKRRKFHR